MTAVDLGSFTKASEVAGYTQSGLTHMMDSLEKEIGFPLLQRGHSGVRLTREGESLMPAVREFLRSNAALENQIATVVRQRSETIRVAAYASIAMKWMPEILYRFRRECPDVTVELRMVDHALEPFELLSAGETDVIFASRHEGMKCCWIPLYREPMYAVLPADYPLNRRTRFPIREFDGLEFLMPYGSFDIDVMAAFDQVGIHPQTIQARVDDETVIRMVGRGLGVTMMAELMLRGSMADVCCVPVEPAVARELGMGYMENPGESIRRLTHCVTTFIGERPLQ